ncbi:MAG: hypothetical protein GF383_12115 [Candidatus Lokiarchaeota archaeon]|nr:hypothetical protein [Candidatus Lokiarchaeota archaeon]MBD3341683.1 hypothetical protein [Candidatus Lokiarchaeota archaeon]
MDGFELVKAALTFSSPKRVPVWNIFGKSDVLFLFRTPSKKWQPGHREREIGLFPHVEDTDFFLRENLWKWKKPQWAKKPENDKWFKIKPRVEIDEWGTIWHRGGVDTIGHPERPSLPHWKNLEEYLNLYTPILDDKNSYSFSLELSKSIGKKKYQMGSLGIGPCHIAANMRGFSNFLIDHRKNKSKLRQLLDFLSEQFLKLEDMWLKNIKNLHGFIIYDDLGEQNGPFFSPKTFDEFYKTVYKRLIENAHKHGCDFHLHCCGKIDPLLPYLIEWGLDAIELDSPRMTGYNELKPFRGKLMFWGCVNAQSIYPKGSPKECEREVWHMIRNLGTPKGGYGAYFYPQVDHIQVPRENINAFKRGLRKFGAYSKIPAQWWDHPVEEDWKDNSVPSLPSI